VSNISYRSLIDDLSIVSETLNIHMIEAVKLDNAERVKD